MSEKPKGLYRKIRVAVVNSSLKIRYHSYGDHWIDGFEDAGCEVDVFPYKKIGSLPLGYDLYFFVEIRYNPKTIPWYTSPRALYSWDSHVLGTDYFEKSTEAFDMVYLASKIDTTNMNLEGHENVKWLPEACNPRLHRNLGIDRNYDIGFVGKGNGDRVRNGKTKDDFLGFLRNSKYTCDMSHNCWGEGYAKFMNRANIAFDRVIAHNIGTRIFESAAMGCVPLWADIGVSKECGIHELFKPGEHFMPYNDTIEDLERAIETLINNPDIMKSISEKAQKHVLAKHTYAHRARSVLNDFLPTIREF